MPWLIGAAILVLVGVALYAVYESWTRDYSGDFWKPRKRVTNMAEEIATIEQAPSARRIDDASEEQRIEAAVQVLIASLHSMKLVLEISGYAPDGERLMDWVKINGDGADAVYSALKVFAHIGNNNELRAELLRVESRATAIRKELGETLGSAIDLQA